MYAAAAATSMNMYLLECIGSFVNWSPENTSVSPLRLANAGFKYTGYRDKVACPVCAIEIEGWQAYRSTEPKAEHLIRSPTCPLALACGQPHQSSSKSSTDIVPVTIQIPNNDRRTPSHLVLPSSPSTLSNNMSSATDGSVMPSTNTNSTSSASARQTPTKTSVDHSSSKVVCDNIPTPGIKSIGDTTKTDPSSAERVLSGPINNEASSSAAMADPLFQRIQHTSQEHSSLQDDIDEEQRLEADNCKLLNERTCKVCLDKMINTVFLPCGHLVSCDECAPKLEDCPVCRTHIRGTVRSFFE